MGEATWIYCGKPILHERPDGLYELAEGVTEREALDFCVKQIQAMRGQQERERIFFRTLLYQDGFLPPASVGGVSVTPTAKEQRNL